MDQEILAEDQPRNLVSRLRIIDLYQIIWSQSHLELQDQVKGQIVTQENSQYLLLVDLLGIT
jgi:hypothetical protein